MTIGISNLPTRDSFARKIKESNDKLPGILEGYVTAYVNFKTDPNNNEYNTSFGVAKSNVDNELNALKAINQSILEAINTYNANMSDMNRNINKSKITNTELKRKLGIATGEQAGSGQLIGDYRQWYNNAYNRNWALCIGIVLSFFVTATVFYVPPENRKVDMTAAQVDKLRYEQAQLKKDKIEAELKRNEELQSKLKLQQQLQNKRRYKYDTNTDTDNPDTLINKAKEQNVDLVKQQQDINKELERFDISKLKKVK